MCLYILIPLMATLVIWLILALDIGGLTSYNEDSYESKEDEKRGMLMREKIEDTLLVHTITQVCINIPELFTMPSSII